ncbi:hypothetical protein H1R20_g7644, partial [Candolleomyces eurysporus]
MGPPSTSSGTALALAVHEFVKTLMSNLNTILIDALVEISDDGGIVLDSEFTKLRMLQSLCPNTCCRGRSGRAASDVEPEDANTFDDEVPTKSLSTTPEDPPVAPTSSKNLRKNVSRRAKVSDGNTNAKSLSKGKEAEPRQMQTRLTNKLSPEIRKAYQEAIQELKPGSDLFNLFEVEITDRIEAILALRELRKKIPNLTTIKTIQFSQVTKKDSDDMGVKAASPGHDLMVLVDKHTDKLLGESEHLSSDNFDARWEEKERFLLGENVKTTLTSLGNQYEAWSRCIADDFGKSIVRIVKAKSLDKEGGTTMLFEVRLDTRQIDESSKEMSMANNTEGSSAFDVDLIVFSKTGTRLIGRLDYLAIISSSLKQARLLRLKKAKTMDDVTQAVKELEPEGLAFLLCIIETKHLLAKLEELEKHSPQVIAQSIAVLQRTERRAVPWCLTDGHKWIFGITWKPSVTQEGYHYDAATVNWLTENPRDIEIPEDFDDRSK